MAGPDVGAPIDANGNMTTSAQQAFEWDGRNQLVAAVEGSQRTEFTCDGAGIRRQSSEKVGGIPQSASDFIWCRQALCEKRPQAGGPPRRSFALGTTENSVHVFEVSNHQGSVEATLNMSGQVQTRVQFDPFGRRSTSPVSSNANATYGGLVGDSASGLMFGTYRAYLPEIGRWISEDPLGLTAGSANLVGYVASNVVNSIDPTGLVTWDVDESVGLTEEFSSLEIAKICKAKNPLCGCTTSQLGLGGSCKCENGSVRLSLGIAYKNPLVYVATAPSRYTPFALVWWHENAHHQDNLEILQRARVEGTRLEAKAYTSEPECQATIKSWKENTEAKLKGAAMSRDLLGKKLCWPK
jgi:RHS repeat-associated protein